MKIGRSLRLFLLTHWKGIVLTLLIIGCFYITLNAGFLIVASNEGTCRACHVMEPYFKTWEHSSHDGITCTKCHSLGFNYFTTALVKASTGLYNPRLRASVEDQTCLQSGCHSLEVVERASGFGESVAFDHTTHLTGLRRGEQLRCTSCHTGDPTGRSHFATDENTCYICHFKGAEEGRSVTGCQTCHTLPPTEVEHGGFSFNHQSYVELGVSCEECHVKITRGTAAVEQNRCHNCHVERLESFGDFASMHEKHVTEAGISCFHCHTEIQHQAVQFVSTLDVGCENCHGPQHSSQKQIYMGIGGEGMLDIPSRMFAAKVSCEGCHLQQLQGLGTTATPMETLRTSCVRCHGEGYDDMLDDWIREIQNALDYAEPVERRAQAFLRNVSGDGSNDEIIQILRDGVNNIELIRQGRGVHNVEYAVRLINTSIDQISFALQQSNQAVQVARRPRVLQEPDGYCTTLCHDNLATHGVEFFAEMELDFDHDSHSDSACTTCHSAQRHKERVISKDGCMTCHHTEEAQADFGVGCEDCHGFVTSLYEGEVQVAGLDIEADSMFDADVGCLDCHHVEAQSESLNNILNRCNECHQDWGVEPEIVNDIFLQQEVSTRRKSDGLIVKIESLKESFRRFGASEDEWNRIRQAEDELDIVLRGRPHHNFIAAELILEKVDNTVRELESSRTQR